MKRAGTGLGLGSSILLPLLSVFCFALLCWHCGWAPSLAWAAPADDLVDQGKILLRDHDIPGAHQKFEDALALDPNHSAANLFYAGTRIVRLKDNEELSLIMDQLGVEKTGRDVYDWQADFPSDTDHDTHLATLWDGLFLHRDQKGVSTPIPEGEYTFTLKPVGGGEIITTRTFTARSIPIPTLLTPANGSKETMTTPLLTWDGPDGYYYRVQVYDYGQWYEYYDMPYAYGQPRYIYASGRTLNMKSLAVPAGNLTPNASYVWQVEAWDGPTDDASSNFSASRLRSFTVTAPGATPDLDNQYVWRQVTEDGNEYYHYGVRVLGLSPGEVRYHLGMLAPGAPYQLDLYPEDLETRWNGLQLYAGGPVWAYYSYYEGLGDDGTYTFNLDRPGEDLIVDTYEFTRRDVPIPTPLVPTDRSYVPISTPQFTWDGPDGYYYRIVIRDWGDWMDGGYDSSSPRDIYESPRVLNMKSLTLPSGHLVPHASYAWRVEAWDRSDTGDPCNFGSSEWQRLTVRPTGTSPNLDHVGFWAGTHDNDYGPYTYMHYGARVLGLDPEDVGWLVVSGPDDSIVGKLDPHMLPPDSPSFQDTIMPFLLGTVVPELDGALQNLSKVTEGLNEVVEPDVFMSDAPIEIDYGDALLFQTGLYAAKAVIECLGKYNLDADVDALAREIEQELFQVHEDLLDPYPEFFTILAHIQQFPDIRAFILEGIDAYMLASTSIRAESDPQDDDLVSLDDVDLNEESMVREKLAKAKKSILEPPVEEPINMICRTLQVDLSTFFDQPPDRSLLPQFDEDNMPIPGTFPDHTFHGLLPNTTEVDLSGFVREPPDVHVHSIWDGDEESINVCWDTTPYSDFLRYEFYRNSELVETITDPFGDCRSYPYDLVLSDYFQVYAFYTDGSWTCGGIAGWPGHFGITTESLPGVEEEIGYEVSIEVEGGVPPYRWILQEGELPQGIVLDGETGILSGVTTECGDFSFIVRAEDSDTGMAIDYKTYDLQACEPGMECLDGDGDGYGDPASPLCPFPEFDCDDSNPNVNPGILEGAFGDAVCSDTLDNDCDGKVDGSDPACMDHDQWYVDGAAGGPGTGLPGDPFKTVQAALNVSNTGDRITVADGTYQENLIWPDVQDVRLESASGDSTLCIIEASNGAAPVVSGSFNSVGFRPMPLTIQDVTLTGGSDGIHLTFSGNAFARVELLDNRIDSNTNHGIWIEAENGQTAVLSGNTISHNRIGAELINLDVRLTGNAVFGNTENGIILRGGSNREAKVNDNEIYGNGQDGVDPTYGLLITAGDGYYENVELVGNDVHGNHADYGVWIETDHGTVGASYNRIYDQVDAHTEAGVVVKKVHQASAVTVDIENNKVYGNTGAVGLRLIDEGSGPGEISVANNLIYWNETGLSLTRGSQTAANFTNNVVVDNTGEGFVLTGENTGTVALTSMVLWNNGDDIAVDDSANYSILYSDVEDTGGENEGIGVIHEDPLFTGDHELGVGSPCIDAGSPDPGDNDLDGTPNDMGYTGGEGGYNTYAGFGPEDPVALTEEGVTVAFTNVNTSGRTWAYSGGQYSGVPAEFRLSESAVFVDINTDADYTGPIEICLSYEESQYPEEENIKLLHEEEGAFFDVTTYVDMASNKVCGEVTSLSAFVVAYPACVDHDEDGYGKPGSPSCSGGSQTDCNDGNPDMNPGLTEIPGNGIDDDCNPKTPGWGIPASIVAAEHKGSSDIANNIFLLCIPIGAILFWKGIRRRR